MRRAIRLPLCMTAVMLLAACAGSVEKRSPEVVYFPALPDSPRLQYLTSFSRPADVKTSSSGFAEFILGDEEQEPAAVRKPYGVAVYDGKIYVVDTRGGGYAVFDLAGRRFSFVRGSGAGELRKPINISIDHEGCKYIADTGRDQVVAFDANDRFIRAYGVTGQFKPSDVAVAGERLYVADLQDHEIEVLDKRTGEVLLRFGREGAGKGELYYPTNLAFGPDGDLYVSETGNFRVQRFTPDGRYVSSLGQVGRGFGQFARPKGIGVDRRGRIYVVDAAFENVQLFDAEGRLLMFFGKPGREPQDINMPVDLFIDYDDVDLFRPYAAPGFELEYVVLVSSQFGASKVNAYGFGRLQGMKYGTEGIDDGE